MKNYKFSAALIASALLLGACNKDPNVDEISGDDKDVKILRVSYIYDPGGEDPTDMDYTYVYGSNGFIEKIVFTDDASIIRASFEHRADGIHINSEFGTTDFQWIKSMVSSAQGKVNNVWVLNNGLLEEFKIPGIMNIYRKANGSFDRMELTKVAEDQQDPSYFPLLPKVESYYQDELPNKISSLPNLNWLEFGDDLSKRSVEMDFSYDSAEDIPLKLKRILNEELLHLNKYGVTTFDLYNVGNNTTPVSSFGEGNWLVSFALWDKHILSEKSTHLVSSRVIKHYLQDETGTPVYEKTTTETFPYTHDPIAKTLEIAGLKIWYEVLE